MGGDEPTLEEGAGSRQEKLNQRSDGSVGITNRKYKIQIGSTNTKKSKAFATCMYISRSSKRYQD